MKTKLYAFILFVSAAFMLFQSCSKENTELSWPKGQYNQTAIQKINGFLEIRDELLSSANITLSQFISFSTDSAWNLSESDKLRLRQVRDNIKFPNDSTILQKVIPLEDVAFYMNNTFGGTVGGFVFSAGDVKSLRRLNDVYNGLRLDYCGSKFSPEGGGYAVLRFTSNVTGHLTIPYCEEMGGTKSYAWPTTGSGFTSSSLGNGGFPEYAFNNYYAPNQGAELYEITPAGNEILRAVYNGTQWITIEPETGRTKSTLNSENQIRNGIFARLTEGNIVPVIASKGGKWQIKQGEQTRDVSSQELVSISTYAEYQGFTFHVRGCDDVYYYLTTTDLAAQQSLSLNVIEKGIYGARVSMGEVSRVWEIITE
jgi:hypothetical protein